MDHSEVVVIVISLSFSALNFRFEMQIELLNRYNSDANFKAS